jgi:hypothetical protein
MCDLLLGRMSQESLARTDGRPHGLPGVRLLLGMSQESLHKSSFLADISFRFHGFPVGNLRATLLAHSWWRVLGLLRLDVCRALEIINIVVVKLREKGVF